MPPQGLNVSSTSSGLRIEWEAPTVLSGPTSYLVQVTLFKVSGQVTDVVSSVMLHGFLGSAQPAQRR